MQGFLRQSTNSQTVIFGPMLDDTDYKSFENGLTIANTDILLRKAGGASAAKNSGGATADGARGRYAMTLDATDTNTVGILRVDVYVAGALAWWGTWTVLEEAIYDALFAASATGLLPANVTHFGGAAGTFALGMPAVNTTYWNGTAISSEIPTTLVSVGTGAGQLQVTSGVVQSNAVQISGSSGAADNAEIVFDTDFATNYNATRNAWATNVQDTVGSGNLPANVKAISDDTTAADNAESFFDGTGYAGTNNVIPNVTLVDTTTALTNAPTSGDLTATMKASVNAEVDTAIADASLATAANLALVKAVTDALTTAAAAKLAASAGQIITGTVDSTGHTPTTTEFEADDITEATADHYNGRIIIFTSGDLAGQATDITDYAIASGRGHFTVTEITEAPANDTTFIIV